MRYVAVFVGGMLCLPLLRAMWTMHWLQQEQKPLDMASKERQEMLARDARG